MFFSLANLGAQSARPMEHPELYKYQGELPYTGNKVAFNKWCNELTTEHSFLSMFEGMSPIVRVHGKDNPPVKMHGIHVDYDTVMQPDFLQFLNDHPQSEFRPCWLSTSRNGKCRLTWLFETPASIMSDEHWKKILRRLNKELQFLKWHAGLDEPALADTSRYLEHGTNWIRIPSGKPISTALLSQWFFEAGKDCVSGHKEFNYEIPMEDIAKEVHTRYPGRWQGDFRLGAQGVRFWDPSADNPTGAWIRKDGVYCFTGTQSFVPWVQILGKEFMAKYAMRAIEDILQGSAYDGKSFWQPDADDNWRSVSKDDFSQGLRVKGFGLNKVKGKISEIDQVEYSIKTQRRVENAFPFLFYPSGVITWEGEKYVNTWRGEVQAPAAPMTAERMELDDGATFFPLIHKLITTMFEEVGETDHTQRDSFVAWLKYFYVHALKQVPRPGQAIVIAGPTGKGKTFIVERVIGGLVGGARDATNHLVNGDKFTAQLAKYPLMAVDDSQGIADTKTLLRFSSMVKKYVANPELHCNEKYEKAGTVPWFGRLVILCNLDSNSLRIIPNMDISIRDKISLFKASSQIIDFGEREVNNARIAAELPNFARFLIDWVIPDKLVSVEKRFGVAAYHHPDLLAESMQQGHSTLLEVLSDYFKAFRVNRPQDQSWTGLASLLHHELSMFNPGVMRELNCKTLAQQLGGLAKNGYGVYSKLNRTGTKEWRINFDLQPDGKEILI